jgi:HTH domain
LRSANVKISDAAEGSFKQLKLAVRDSLSKIPLTVKELAEEFKASIATINSIIKTLRTEGANISALPGEKLFLNSLLQSGGLVTLQSTDRGDGWTALGFVTDNHLCNRHARLDVLNYAYDTFQSEGITTVLNAGNWIDGEARFNREELIVAPGMDPQLDYAVENYPQRKGITTYYVSGADHEGWFIQRECVNVGEYFQMKAEKAGRKDLRFLGHIEADIRLQYNKKSTVCRLMHPGGGSSYAFSYAPQKLVESFQGGEKPAILLIGHYHKFDLCYPREVHVLSGGCTTDQSGWMRKNKIAAHVGYSIVKYQQERSTGNILRLAVEWCPFYDRGFYERRFG